jgi:hypothetical protein
MTVQTPQEPAQYPSAPPWAGDPEPVATPPTAVPLYGGTVPPYDSPDNKHGQLLVRFPGEVRAGHRPEAPSWRPVVIWTFLLSALGVISVLRRASQARQYGRSRRPYWIAFVATLLAGAAFWTTAVAVVAIPAYQYRVESGITERLRTTLASDARVRKQFGVVSGVECTSETDRNAEGLRTYLCTFQMSNGKTNGLFVNADVKGNWQEKE